MQNVLLTLESDKLRTRCVFVEGVGERSTCTVLIEGEGRQWIETFNDSYTFSDMPTGNYTVKVYDSVYGIGQEPGVERNIIITQSITELGDTEESEVEVTHSATDIMNEEREDEETKDKSQAVIIAISIGECRVYSNLSFVLNHNPHRDICGMCCSKHCRSFECFYSQMALSSQDVTTNN